MRRVAWHAVILDELMELVVVVDEVLANPFRVDGRRKGGILVKVLEDCLQIKSIQFVSVLDLPSPSSAFVSRLRRKRDVGRKRRFDGDVGRRP